MFLICTVNDPPSHYGTFHHHSKEIFNNNELYYVIKNQSNFKRLLQEYNMWSNFKVFYILTN